MGGRLAAQQPPLSRHRDFVLLWTGVTASMFGARVGFVALPLVAVLMLDATPLQMGVLTAAQTLGVLLFGLPAGAVVDRMRRRRVMVVAESVRAAALLTLPVAFILGAPALNHLVMVALAMGVTTVFFDLAQQAHLPMVVGRERLVEANSRLQASQSVAAVTGPSAGGGAVGLVGGATALLAAGLLSLASAIVLRRMPSDPPRTPVPAREREDPCRSGGRRSWWNEMVGGLRIVLTDGRLRAIACCTGSTNLFMVMVLTVAVLFLAHDLSLPAWAVGVVLAAGGAGGVAAAVTTRHWTARFGQVRSIWLTLAVTQPFGLLLPLAGGRWGVLVFSTGWLIVGYGVGLYNITQVSFRQTICPNRVLGRVSAANRVVAWGTAPVGAMLAGLIGESLGVLTALWVGVVGLIVSVLWVMCSPLRHREADSPVAE